MTKLQVLNAYFTERLMAAAQEILQVVGETMMEYQEETDRGKRENENLRRRLREAGLDYEAGLTNRYVTEQRDWRSTGQDTLTAVKLEFTELQWDRQEEEEHRGLEPATDGAEPGGQTSEFEAQLSPETLDRLRGQRAHFCPQCGKAFRHMCQEHQLIHTGEKPHLCSVCGKCFGKSAHLQRHLRIHTGEKPYRCPVCERCFTQSCVMKRHLQVHNSFTYS
ncbi:hypothetical protein SKAU_G00170250 [Synaphobranchus kaupii]|uniref:C2H2-type domain-containing protein n=1 Tax=Synaphobranchus kaupii TaxID=118154 RepID=A0A9Q1FKV7_SYNKA|nr:hypothetical protein SKAU_G00170250 [Synaphobranchus kaupii]